MTCEELKPDYLLYAMGTMSELESGEVRAHLARGCPACTEGVRKAQTLACSMGAALDGPEAPRELRARVLAIAGSPDGKRQAPAPVVPIRNWRRWMLAAACLALAAVPGLLWLRDSSEWRAKEAATTRQIAGDRDSIASLRDQVAKLKGAAVNAAAIFALDIERGADTTPKRIAIPPGTAAIVLALPSDLARQASSAEIRNASGQSIWTVSPLPASDADSTGLTISAGLLTPGRYTIVLLVQDRTVARFPFEVAR